MNDQGVPLTPLRSQGAFSTLFIERGIHDFEGACALVRGIPFGRNADKTDLRTVLSDNRGTCSTKHALLKSLAAENNIAEVRLVLGIFRMSAVNTPAVATTLLKYGLAYIPEAHNYLRVAGELLDYTKDGFPPLNFEEALFIEIEFEPHQITDFKVAYHRQFLQAWLNQHLEIQYDLDALWAIREQCVADLSDSRIR